MKIRNNDLAKLNELKLDLLSPPYTFRLSSIAAGFIDSSIEIIKKYVAENDSSIGQLNELKIQIESANEMPQIRKLCKEAAAIITYFTRGT